MRYAGQKAAGGLRIEQQEIVAGENGENQGACANARKIRAAEEG
jgi:hypothetical protein